MRKKLLKSSILSAALTFNLALIAPNEKDGKAILKAAQDIFKETEIRKAAKDDNGQLHHKAKEAKERQYDERLTRAEVGPDTLSPMDHYVVGGEILEAHTTDFKATAEASRAKLVRDIWSVAAAPNLQISSGAERANPTIDYITDSVSKIEVLASRFGNVSTHANPTKIKIEMPIFLSVLSPDGKFIAFASSDRYIIIYNIETREERTLDGIYRDLFSLAWSPDGDKLAFGSRNNIFLFDTKTWQPIGQLEGHQDRVISIAWSYDGQKLVSSSNDGSLRIWNIETREQIHVMQKNTSASGLVAWSQYGDRLIATSDFKSIRIFNNNTGEQIFELKGHGNPVTSIAWSPNGQILASCSDDASVWIWNCDTGTGEVILKLEKTNISNVAWSPDGQTISVVVWNRNSLEYSVIVYHLQTLQKYAIFSSKTYHDINKLSFSPDGYDLFVISNHEIVILPVH